MVIDTSAIVALLTGEERADVLVAALDQADERVISCATMLEATMVLESRRATGADRVLDAFVKRLRIDSVPFDDEQYQAACDAFRRYGKGRHPAGLNFGDCFAYALTVVRDDELLFIGDDFKRTDVRSALA